MKRIIKLTESDLARLIKRVIKEQSLDDNDHIDNYGGNDEDLDDNGQIDNDGGDEDLDIPLNGESQPTHMLKKRLNANDVTTILNNLPEELMFLALLDCEYADFSAVDLCSHPNLRFINVTSTPNNFEEQEYECAGEKVSDGMFAINSDM